MGAQYSMFVTIRVGEAPPFYTSSLRMVTADAVPLGLLWQGEGGQVPCHAARLDL